MTMSPQALAVMQRLGYFIPVYPALARALGSTNAAILFARLMYHEDRRISSGAETFARTDAQLADECGLGAHELDTARAIVCGQFELFERSLRGVPPTNHYCADHARIHRWLSAKGLEAPALTDEPPIADRPANWVETGHLNARKPPVQLDENRRPLKNLNKNSDSDDDARKRVQIATADKLLRQWGIENPSRARILAHLRNRPDIVEVVSGVCTTTLEQWKADLENQRHTIKRPNGLIVSRLLHEIPGD